MNEQAQIDAIKAELVAEGYQPAQDVEGLPSELGGMPILKDVMLDIVATLQPTEDVKDRPRLVIVEIANRSRRPEIGKRRSSWGRVPDDNVAVQRFKLISGALAEREEVAFQIRFLDVSADQANARRLFLTKIRNKDGMLANVRDHQLILALSSRQPDLARALIVARLWSHWIRVIGNLHPGREHKELKDADLRTLHKDLYDQKLVELTPNSYRRIHLELLAVVEGGDFLTKDLLSLEPDVRRLLDWAALYYGSSFAALDHGETGTVFANLSRDIQERAPEIRRDELLAAAARLRIFDGTDIYSRELARFQLQIGQDGIVSSSIMEELLRRAAE